MQGYNENVHYRLKPKVAKANKTSRMEKKKKKKDKASPTRQIREGCVPCSRLLWESVHSPLIPTPTAVGLAGVAFERRAWSGAVSREFLTLLAAHFQGAAAQKSERDSPPYFCLTTLTEPSHWIVRRAGLTVYVSQSLSAFSSSLVASFLPASSLFLTVSTGTSRNSSSAAALPTRGASDRAWKKGPL